MSMVDLEDSEIPNIIEIQWKLLYVFSLDKI